MGRRFPFRIYDLDLGRYPSTRASEHSRLLRNSVMCLQAALKPTIQEARFPPSGILSVSLVTHVMAATRYLTKAS